MTVHLLRMAAGIESIDQLKSVQAARMAGRGGEKSPGVVKTFTRNVPRRASELLDGGSIDWVMKRFLRARQTVLGCERLTNSEGRTYAALTLDAEVTRVELRPQKAFQGWRYLRPEDAPVDLAAAARAGEGMPPEMVAELRQLGLL